MSSRRRRRKALIDHFIACTLEESTFPQKHSDKNSVVQPAEVESHEGTAQPETVQSGPRPAESATIE
jgi:hypothetical protein